MTRCGHTEDATLGDWHIRLAVEADQEAIAEINRHAWSGGITTYELLEQRHGPIDGKPWAEQIVEAAAAHLAQPHVTTFVAERDGQIVGYAAAEMKQVEPPADVGIVSYNAVDPGHQGRGIGTALVRRVVEHLKEQGARVLLVWTLEADEPACRIYERLGFKELTRFIYYSRDR
jgi:GNAT superfamily N-acetyltransferase